MSGHSYPDKMSFDGILPDSYLIEIGRVCAAWGMLEGAVDMAIQKFAGFDLSDERGAIIVSHMTWPLKMDVLSAHIHSLLPNYPWLERYSKNVQPTLKAAQEGRNRIAHGRWGIDDGKVTIARLTARGKLKTSIEPISLDEIKLVTDHIGIAAAQLFKLVLNK